MEFKNLSAQLLQGDDIYYEGGSRFQQNIKNSNNINQNSEDKYTSFAVNVETDFSLSNRDQEPEWETLMTEQGGLGRF